ncbi:Ubiquitin-conjugating enzyme E2 22 [Linum perenne]
MATNENLPPNVIKQLAKELKSLDESPPEGIKVGVNEDDLSVIYADIEGPDGTPYESGIFRMKLLLPHDFPRLPPQGFFLTKIFHPNISSDGKICVNALKKDWNPSLGLRHVLVVVRCLLIEPFPESALNEQAAKMLLENYEDYSEHARLITEIHAKPKPKFKSGAISESTTALNVDQSNTSVDHKSTTAGAAVPSAFAPCSTTSKGGNNMDQSGVAAETGSGAAPIIVTGSVKLANRKEVAGQVKAPVDKKKIDARKKSLKRL